MNENVNTKIPKRKRWVARLLVSALCILLASSLLFVSVVAETEQVFRLAPYDFTDLGIYSFAGLGYFQGAFGSCFVQYSPATNIGHALVSLFDESVSWECESFSLSHGGLLGNNLAILDVGGTDVMFWVYYGFQNKYVLDVFNYAGDNTYSVELDGFDMTAPRSRYVSYVSMDGYVFSYGTVDNWGIYENGVVHSTNGLYCAAVMDFGTSFPLFVSDSGADSVFNLSDFSFAGVQSVGIPNSYDVFYYYFFFYTVAYDFNSNSVFAYVYNEGSLVSFPGDDLALGLRADCYLFESFITTEFDGDLVGFARNWGSSYYPTDPYLAYLVFADTVEVGDTSSESSDETTVEPPPASSDETTEEPPPESSEESSEEPTLTKIWRYDRYRDGSEGYAVFAELDLTGVTDIEAYIGAWTAYDSPFQSDTAVPLTLRLYRGDSPPEIVTFDFYAYGWAVGERYTDPTFEYPDYVGYWFDIGYEGSGDLYFATSAPYGTVFVNFSGAANIGDRCTFNLTSEDSYFRIDFANAENFAVVVFNDDNGPGASARFNLSAYQYKMFYSLDDELSQSAWYKPGFGSSVTFTASEVVETGLYAFYIWTEENGGGIPSWNDTISDANSRLEEISRNEALMESIANDLYGGFPFDPMVKPNFDTAVSQIGSITDSSGGDYILSYLWGMWTVHPFASSMIAIVGTLAIVGFIVRKM